MKGFVLFILLNIVGFVAKASSCESFLSSSLRNNRNVNLLSVNTDQKSSVLLRLLKYKYLHTKTINLNEVSEYLNLNQVHHSLFDDYILIHAHGQSALNRFARRLKLESEKINLQVPTGLTELIFKPKKNGINSTAQFMYFNNQDQGERALEIIAENKLLLSMDAVFNLKPTLTEFHELVHWKSYFFKSKFNLNSLVLGHVDVGGNPGGLVREVVNQEQAFSFEEFEAHLLTLTKRLRKLKYSKDEDLKADLEYEIKSEMASLAFYSAKAKKLILQFFKKSIFQISKNATDLSVVEQPNLILEKDILEVANFDWFEQVASYSIGGLASNPRGLEYLFLLKIERPDHPPFSEHDDWSLIHIYFPSPKSLTGINDFRLLRRPENKKAYTDISKSIYYKMYFLLELIKYTEDLNIKISSNELDIDSPMEHFHKINRAYKASLQQL